MWIALTMLPQLLPAEMDRRLRPLQLTLFEYGVLMALADAPERALRVSGIAERTYVPLPRVSRVVTRLEARGLVRRDACASDGRASTIELTGEGRRLLAQAAPIHAQAARELVLSALGDGKVATAAAILGPLVARLDPDGPLSEDASRS